MIDSDIVLRFEVIYDETYTKVLRFVMAKCSDTADIEDIMPETYLELYQLLKRRGLNYIVNDEAIVIKLAKQKIYKYYTLKERLKSIVPMSLKRETGEEFDLIDLNVDLYLEEELKLQQVKLSEARQWLQKKDAATKKVFYLFYDQDLTIKEISALLNLTESNVKHKLYRTLKELRALLG